MNRISVNISLLWTDRPFAHRFAAAVDSGFEWVEFWPWEDSDVIRREISRTGLSVSVLNVYPGPTGSHGQLSNPDATEWWQTALDEAVSLASDLGCTTVNALTGNRMHSVPLGTQLETAATNLARGLDRMDGTDIDLVLEPLGPDRAHYLTRTVADAVAMMAAAGNPHRLKLLFDFYHLAQTETGSVARVFRDSVSIIKHVQVADTPGRHEPGSGDIDWLACRTALIESRYSGTIGFEYEPLRDTAESLQTSSRWWGGLPEVDSI